VKEHNAQSFFAINLNMQFCHGMAMRNKTLKQTSTGWAKNKLLHFVHIFAKY